MDMAPRQVEDKAEGLKGPIGIGVSEYGRVGEEKPYRRALEAFSPIPRYTVTPILVSRGDIFKAGCFGVNCD